MRRFRPRKEFKFWLYHDLAIDVRLMEYIAYLRETRQFATAIRNGLRLLWTMGEGDYSVLDELFPEARAAKEPPPQPTPPDSGDMQRLVTDAAREGAKQALLELPANIPAPPPGYPAMKPAAASVGNLKGAKDIAMPVFDEDESDEGDTIVIRKSETSKAEQDIWLENMFAMQKSLGNEPITDSRIRPREFKPRHTDDDDDVMVKRAIQ